MKACSKEKCFVSTGIHEGLTFGGGELDSLGYFTEPCYECARANDERMNVTLRELREKGVSEQVLRMEYEYLFIESWPFTKE